MKTCKKCGSTEFYKNGRHCKACAKRFCDSWRENNPSYNSVYSEQWRKENPEYAERWRIENAERSANYRAENKERRAEIAVAWKLANPDRFIAYRIANKLSNYDAIRYAANPLRRLAKSAEWAKKNPEARRIHSQNRRAREKAAGGTLSTDLATRLFKLQRGKCACCKLPLGDNYHLDHIMPIALGGANEDWNIQLLRQQCNNQKHAKNPLDFMQSRGYLL